MVLSIAAKEPAFLGFGRRWGGGSRHADFPARDLASQIGQGDFVGELSFVPQRHHRAVHAHHAFGFPRFHHVAESLGLAFADQGGNGGVPDQEFAREGEPAVFGRKQTLADDPAQTFGHHRSDLRLLGGWKDVEKPVQSRGGVARVHGSDNEVPGFGSADGHFDGFKVAHFTDDNDVRVLPERAFQGSVKGLGVLADAALGNGAAVGLMNELDRFLHGDEMILSRQVEVMHQGGEGGGFSGADRTRDDDQAVVVGQQLFDRFCVAEAEFREGSKLAGNRSIGTGAPVLVDHEIGAVAFAGGEGQRKVEILMVLKGGPLGRGQERAVQPCRDFGAERFGIQVLVFAIAPHERPRRRAQVEIARAARRRVPQQSDHRVPPAAVAGALQSGKIRNAGLNRFDVNHGLP